MKLKSPHRYRDRILAFGSYGAGKTYAWFQWAKAITGHVYVIDTDQTVLPYLESEQFADVEDRLTWEEPYEWPEFMEAILKFRKLAKPDDLIVVDMMSAPWAVVQTYFSEQVYGMDDAEFWLEYRKQLESNDGKGSKSAFDGMVDWQPIKRMYYRFTNNLIRCKGHIYMATGEKSIGPFDGAEVQREYGQAANGKKPEGEKTLGHLAHTVLRFNNQRISTVKDRQRKDLMGQKFDDFAADYLLKVAGWIPTAG